MFKNFLLCGTVSALPLLALSAPAHAQTNSEDEIIVTGSPLAQSVDDITTGISVLSGEELQERLASSIGETLKYEPGLSSTFFGAGASRPIIRGQDGDRIRILNNGIGSIDASSASPDHAVAAEPAQAERIEVLRGASILRYGSSGSGGIVNVIDGRIPDSIPEGRLDGAVRAGYSTVDEGVELAGSVDIALTDNLVAHFDGTFKDAGDFEIPVPPESEILEALEEAEGEEHDEEEEAGAGPLENSYSESESFTAGLSYIGDWGHFGVAYHDLSSEYGLPGGHEEGHEEEEEDHEEEEHEEEEGVFIVLDQTRFDVNGALNLDGVIEKIQLFAGYADYEHVEFEGPGEAGTVYSNEGGEMRLEAIQKQRQIGDKGWDGAYGLHYRTRDFSAIGEEAFVPETTTDQIALYTFQKLNFTNAHIEGALRYEIVDQENIEENETLDFDLFSISVGGDYSLSDTVSLGGTVFHTERAPAAEELFAGGPHLATGQFEVGNEDLDVETSTGIEGVLRVKAGGIQFVANAYHTSYDDFIYLQNTDEDANEVAEALEEEHGHDEEEEEEEHAHDFDELTVARFTAEDARFTGFEAQVIVPFGAIGRFNLTGDALLEYVRAKTDSANLPRIPPLSILTGLEADYDALNLRAELEYVDSASNLAPLEIATEDYTLVNLFIGYDLPMGDKNIRLSGAINNLFDDEARQHSSFLKDIVPLPGRNFKATIRATF